MARLLRVDRPSLWYHLPTRGNEQRLTFRDDRYPERSAAAGVGSRGRLLFVECSKLAPIHAWLAASMFLAPADGYFNDWHLAYLASDIDWSYAFSTKRFYLKSRDGQIYGRLTVEAYAYYLKDKLG